MVAIALALGCGASARPVPERPTRPDAPPELLVHFEDQMGMYFRFEKLELHVDGAVLFMRACGDDASCSERMRRRLLYFGVVAGGEHTANAALVYQSNPRRGLYSYIRACTFRLRSSHTLTVRRGHRVELDIVAHERGAVTTPIEERPAVRWVERTVPL